MAVNIATAHHYNMAYTNLCHQSTRQYMVWETVFIKPDFDKKNKNTGYIYVLDLEV